MARNQIFKDTMIAGTDANNDLISFWCIKAPNNNVHAAHCLVCATTIDVKLRGRDAVIRHSKKQLHIANAEKHRDESGNLTQQKSNQKSLIECFNRPVGKPTLSFTDQVTAAEAIWCATLAVAHLSANVCDTIIPTFPAMFPDSKIAAAMTCKRSKASCIISDGLGPYFRELVQNEIRNSALSYTLEIDETTTAKHWRQLDILVRYFSEQQKRVVVFHIASFTIGRAQATIICDKIAEVATPLYTHKLLQISSDGPNVMKALTKQVKASLNPHLIDINTCNIHKVHNAFHSAYDSFGDNVEQLGIELYYFFKASAVRREDFEKVQAKVGITKHIFLRHVPSRWLTLEAVTDRLEEQLPAIKHYFINSILISDKDRLNNERVKRLVKIVKNKVLVVEMQFLKSVMPIFTRVTRLFQSEAPLIHILYDELSTLVATLIRRFIKPEIIGTKFGKQLYDINLEVKENYLKRVNIGHKASESLRIYLIDGEITEEEVKAFYSRARIFFKSSVLKLLKTLPLNNVLLQDLQVLHPISRFSDSSVQAIQRLALAIKHFPQDKIDSLIDEWKAFRVEELPEEWNLLPLVSPQLTDENEEIEIFNSVTTSDEIHNYGVHRIDDFWAKIFTLKSLSGVKKYPILETLIKICLSISHGNADVERSFSENKMVMTAARTKMADITLHGYRSISSFLKKYENKPEKMEITATLCKAVRNAKAKHDQRIAAQKKATEILNLPSVPKIVEEPHEGLRMANLKLNEAACLKKEGLNMLEEACKTSNMNKANAAQAILQRSEKIQSDATTQKRKAEDEIDKKKNQKRARS